MFTGLIEETGRVVSLRRGGTSSFIRIEAEKVLEGTVTGDSIAVSGVCLTVTEMGSGWFQADVMNETLSRSSLGSLKPGDPVNLERAMAAGGRFGGHIVSGHIDGTGTVTDIKNDGIAVWYTIAAKPEILRYIVEKGSVALDGISLTVARVTAESFSVSVIPHTAAVTTLSRRKTGDKINIENDIIGKYVEKLMQPAESSSGGLSMGFLAENGFI
ncbi:MAG: riboflavin synthase [Ruminococcus sp.]|nr:riboflavin synthase [Ruminococcus sp.]